MTVKQNTLDRLKELDDVTDVESARAERTYIVWLHGYADARVLEEIERISGWSLASFYGAMGTDIGVCYANTASGDEPFEYDVSLTAFDYDQYESQSDR